MSVISHQRCQVRGSILGATLWRCQVRGCALGATLWRCQVRGCALGATLWTFGYMLKHHVYAPHVPDVK